MYYITVIVQLLQPYYSSSIIFHCFTDAGLVKLLVALYVYSVQ